MRPCWRGGIEGGAAGCRSFFALARHLLRLDPRWQSARQRSEAAKAQRLAATVKLARLIYAMLSKGEDCMDAGQDYCE
jgi:hypothetical protein